jgi:hypothetical protein
LAKTPESLPLSRISVRSVSVDLKFYSIAAERLATMNCRNCRAELDIHQPNPSQPDQFLGTCPGCRAWYRVESRPGERRATVVQLPEVSEVNPPETPDNAPG